MSKSQQSGSSLTPDIVKNYRKIEAIIPSHWTEDKVFANGINHHYYRTGGDKPQVLLLHGFLEGALSWLSTARVLEKEYDVIMVDARGHGHSDGIETGYSQELLTEDAAGVIRSLKLKKPHLIGFSQGGGIGIFVAANYPDLVKSLTVVGAIDEASVDVNTDFSKSEGYMAWYNSYLAWLEQLKTQSHEERMVSALSQLYPGAPVPSEDEYVAWVDMCAHLDLDLVRLSISFWSKLGEGVNEMKQALKGITCPTLMMKSSAFPNPEAKKYVKEETSDQANIKVFRFVNTGHLIPREQFQQFIGLLKDFLGNL